MRALILPVLLVAACSALPMEEASEGLPLPQIPWAPRSYACLKVDAAPVIDGRLDDPVWDRAPFSVDFTDIVGPAKPSPRFRTRMKMLWGNGHLYIAALMEEPDVWGRLTLRDSVIYHDNDFEVFIDPDGDTHEYFELEINALGTEWDLLIPKPYRDNGHGVNGFDIAGLRTAVSVDGTLNRPGDRDRGWSVEIAIPFAALAECANRECPPKPGDTWRMNFSRVEWRARVSGGRYEKILDPVTGDPLPEDNWVWSPQGLVAVHYPEMWGFVTFVDALPAQAFAPGPAERAAWDLRRVYYAERSFFARHRRYTGDPGELLLPDPPAGLSLQATASLFEAMLGLPDGRAVRITQDGRVREVAP